MVNPARSVDWAGPGDFVPWPSHDQGSAHFFDQAYYPCLDATVGHPYALYVHGNNDTMGAVRAVESIATGLRWRRLCEPVTVIGTADAKDRGACWELGASTAAHLMP
ncbi:hypothetical protein FAIPA1_230052 [Frankia sp. AiPs1]